MKILLTLLLVLGLTATLPAEKINIGAGKSVTLTLPDTWTIGDDLPMPADTPTIERSLHYVTKDGSNEAVLITFLSTEGTPYADPEKLKAYAAQVAQANGTGAVEKELKPQELKTTGGAGFSVTLTDAKLVGRPAKKGDYKAMILCFVHLGDQTMFMGSIFSDDLNGPAAVAALRIVKSIQLQRTGRAI